MTTNARRTTLALASALVLAVTAAMPAAAAWTNTIVDTMFYYARPSLDVDGADHTAIATARRGDSPGIFFASNATGDWVTTRISASDDAAPSLAIDDANDPHIGFTRRSGTAGIYFAEDTTGSWTTPALAAADLDPRSPSIAADAAGKVGIAYVSNFSFDPGLFFVTNATGSWVKTKIASATWAVSPSLAYDAAGKAHILFSRLDLASRGVYHATNETGSWVVTPIWDNVEMEDVQFVFDAAGKIHASMRDVEPGAVHRIFYYTNKDGPWLQQRLESDSFETQFGDSTIGYNAADDSVHIYTIIHDDGFGAERGRILHYLRRTDSGGLELSELTPTDGGSRIEFGPSIGFRSDGIAQLAFGRLYPTAGIRIHAGETTTSSLVAGSSLVNNGASIDLGPGGVRDVAYDKIGGTGGTTMFATGSGASWSKEAAGTGEPARFATDLAVDTAGKVRIVDGANYFSNVGGTWDSDLSLTPGAETEVEVDAAAHAHVLVNRRNDPYWTLEYRTNATGSWGIEEPVPAQDFLDNPQASLALDAAGKPHIAWLFPDGSGGYALNYQNRISGSWTFQEQLDSGVLQWPSIAVDGAGKVHIAYAQYSGSPGIYYLTNKSGSWVRTRLTRSYSDGAPSLALDSAGHVYVATTRFPQAASPGIYVMTNTTGSWVVTRVIATEAAGQVSLTVTSTGLARFVYDSDVAVHEYENSTATLSAAAAPTFQDATFSDVLRSQLMEVAATSRSTTGASPSIDGPAPRKAAGSGPTTTISVPHPGQRAP